MVRLLQCLCPNRHCILGLAYEPGRTEAPEDITKPDGPKFILNPTNATDWFRREVKKLIVPGGLNPWCELCKSRNFRYEDAPSIFETLEEAWPVLKASEEAQRRTAEYFKASRN